MTGTWGDFRNSGGWPYETDAETEKRLAERLAALGQPAEDPEQPGQQREPEANGPTG